MLCLQSESIVDSPSLTSLAQNRLCSHYLDNVVGDEKNFVFECAFLQPLRLKYHVLFTSPITSMRCFFSQKDSMSAFKFILECLHMMHI